MPDQAPQTIEDILDDLYYMGQSEDSINATGGDMSAEKAIRNTLASLTALIEREVIGEDVTQQERHWVSEIWGDMCGKEGTRSEYCICEQLNALKTKQRHRLHNLTKKGDK